MSRLYDDAQSEYLRVESPVITAYPFAMVSWFNTDLEGHQSLVWCGDKDVTDRFCHLQARGGEGNNPVAAYSHTYGSASVQKAISSTGYTVNTWHHAAGIWVGVSDRRAFIDGGSKGTDANEVGAMDSHDRTTIGVAGDSSPSGYMSGKIAESAIWDLSVWPGATNSDKADNFEKILPSLAKGFTPLYFPLGLVAYWPLIRGINDRVGGYNLTASGTSVAAHPRIIYPCKVL